MNPAKILAALIVMLGMAGAPGLAPAQQPSDQSGAAQGNMMGQGMGQGMGPGNMGPGMGQGMGQGMGYGMGQGMGSGMGQGMGYGMGGYGMGPGMMGQGMMGRHGGMMGGNWGYIPPPVNLSVADVKSYMERWVEGTGNPRLKLGKVTEKDADTITADIVTKDDSLVQEFEVDRHTGFYRAVK